MSGIRPTSGSTSWQKAKHKTLGLGWLANQGNEKTCFLFLTISITISLHKSHQYFHRKGNYRWMRCACPGLIYPKVASWTRYVPKPYISPQWCRSLQCSRKIRRIHLSAQPPKRPCPISQSRRALHVYMWEAKRHLTIASRHAIRHGNYTVLTHWFFWYSDEITRKHLPTTLELPHCFKYLRLFTNVSGSTWSKSEPHTYLGAIPKTVPLLKYSGSSFP